MSGVGEGAGWRETCDDVIYRAIKALGAPPTTPSRRRHVVRGPIGELPGGRRSWPSPTNDDLSITMRTQSARHQA